MCVAGRQPVAISGAHSTQTIQRLAAFCCCCCVARRWREPSICRDNYRRRLLLHQVYNLYRLKLFVWWVSSSSLSNISSRPILMVFSQSSTTHIDSLCIHTHYIDVRVCVCVDNYGIQPRVFHREKSCRVGGGFSHLVAADEREIEVKVPLMLYIYV